MDRKSVQKLGERLMIEFVDQYFQAADLGRAGVDCGREYKHCGRSPLRNLPTESLPSNTLG